MSFSLKNRVVLFDTMLLIYLFEDVAPFAAKCEALFERVRNGELKGIITPITMAELVVKPLAKGRSDIAESYRLALENFPNLQLFSITPAIGTMAGALCAKYKLPLPDLFQVASAMSTKATLLTNDKALSRIEEIPVMLLDICHGSPR